MRICVTRDMWEEPELPGCIEGGRGGPRQSLLLLPDMRLWIETCLTLELRSSTENGDLRLAVPGTAVKRSLVTVIPHDDPLSKR